MHPKVNVTIKTDTHDNDITVYADTQVTALQCYI